MVGIEFKRVIKEGFIILLVLTGLVVGILTSTWKASLATILEIFLLLYASFTGWSIFDRERSEGAMEYLLSLPVSRLRLLIIKLLPRVLSVSLVLLLYIVLHGRFQFPSLLPVFDFSLFYITFFLVSLSLSLSWKSFIGVFFLAGILSGGLTLFAWILDSTKSESELFLQANLYLLIFPVLFFIIFRFYDVRPVLSFNLKFTGLIIGSLVLIAGISYLAAGINWCQYILLDKGYIFRHSCRQSQYLNENEEIIHRLPGCQIPMFKKGNSLYIQKREKDETLLSIDLLDLESGSEELLYQIPDGWRVMGSVQLETGFIAGDKFYVLMGNGEEKKVKILGITKDMVSEITLKENFIFSGDSSFWHESTFVYISPQPLCFLIFCNNTLYRVDETGNAEALEKIDYLSVWNNRVLLYNDNGIRLFEISPEGKPDLVFKKDGYFRRVRRKFGSFFSRKVLIRDQERGKYSIFNLEDTRFTDIPMPYSPYFFLETENRFYIVWARDNEISIGEIKDNRLEMKKEWVTPIKGRRITRVFASGVIIYNAKEYETYWFE